MAESAELVTAESTESAESIFTNLCALGALSVE